MTSEPVISVGVLTAPAVDFEGEFAVGTGGETLRGPSRASVSGASILIECGAARAVHASGVLLTPSGGAGASFVIRDVTIGIRFHWERKEDQRFTGALRLIARGSDVVAVNVVSVEDYLASVISSEMSAGSSMNLLKAHAITSRSWLLAQLDRSAGLKEGGKRPRSTIRETDRIVRWYDREEHDLFDVCADDHCQRYQGITKSTSPSVREAVDQTRGSVVMSGESICDARFSKSCGGITEPFSKVWQPVDVPYLVNIPDIPPFERLPDRIHGADVSREELAEWWIRSSPPAFCNTTDKRILSQVLLKYDQETTDFYRWTVEYTQEYAAALIREKSGIDFGAILDIAPVERGPSGRLTLVKIVGERKTMTIGKELEIRRTLSPSHLYSSAFIVERHDVVGSIPGRFVL
ncbi:MAG TPA: SpoIID/LytB domain-containing protein, partial [Bacteroidota bacterium]|nr:SpoIID/LytB domain-containing protein [Bacteroidota bacterium]